MYGRDFSLGHFNQHGRISGEIQVGDEALPIDGRGWRDHSWGPRYWQAIYYYRLFLANFDNGDGFMLLKITDRSGYARRVGVLLVDGQYEEITDLDVITDWTGAQDPRGCGSACVPPIARRSSQAKSSRSRPCAIAARLTAKPWFRASPRGFTRFDWDGREGFGMTEYIERIEDGTGRLSALRSKEPRRGEGCGGRGGMIRQERLDHGILKVEIDNRARRNALDVPMFEQLAALWPRLDADRSVRLGLARHPRQQRGNPARQNVFNMDESDFDDVIRVHLKGTLQPESSRCHLLAGPRQRGLENDARIINTSSPAGLYGNVGQPNYSSAKAGIAALRRSRPASLAATASLQTRSRLVPAPV